MQIFNDLQKSKEFFDVNHGIARALFHEAEAINFAANFLPCNAKSLVALILNTKGRIIFSGMGKSGYVCKKLVATFASLGVPALFLHPSEALHGDLGNVQKNDFFIALSKSATGHELETIISILSSQNIKTSLICCRNGKLCDLADMSIILPFKGEACNLNLAPTSSSTLMMAFGDALAIVIAKIRGFSKNDFARFHPAGALGRRLLLTVNSFMHPYQELPFIDKNDSFLDLVLKITSKKLGMGIVIDEEQNLLGIITDGDLRRACSIGKEVFASLAKNIMHKNPKTIESGSLALDALKIMEDFNITSLIVLQKRKIVGLVHIHDLVKAGIKE